MYSFMYVSSIFCNTHYFLCQTAIFVSQKNEKKGKNSICIKGLTAMYPVPLFWKKTGSAITAGRSHSGALRL